MFDTEQLKQVDPAYFNIIMADDMDVTVQSRNTGHYWYLHWLSDKRILRHLS